MPPQANMPKMGLEALVDQLEELDKERRQTDALAAEAYRHAREAGYDVKAVKALIRRRRLDTTGAAETDALVDAYDAQLAAERQTREAS
jgi:uncharacterized protein (UPF0335 family)